jgi:hypothetical protein
MTTDAFDSRFKILDYVNIIKELIFMQGYDPKKNNSESGYRGSPKGEASSGGTTLNMDSFGCGPYSGRHRGSDTKGYTGGHASESGTVDCKGGQL